MTLTTPQKALQTARAYVAEERGHYCHVKGLLQDDEDYYILLSLNDGHIDWPLGPGPLFVSKATGKVWDDAFGNVLEKIQRMQAL